MYRTYSKVHGSPKAAKDMAESDSLNVKRRRSPGRPSSPFFPPPQCIRRPHEILIQPAGPLHLSGNQALPAGRPFPPPRAAAAAVIVPFKLFPEGDHLDGGGGCVRGGEGCRARDGSDFQPHPALPSPRPRAPVRGRRRQLRWLPYDEQSVVRPRGLSPSIRRPLTIHSLVCRTRNSL